MKEKNKHSLPFFAIIIILCSFNNVFTSILANTFLYPPEQPFPKTPADYGYEYKDVEFPASDGLTFSGWLLNEQADKVIIMTHFGYRANRFGYQTEHQGLVRPYDKEIEFVKVAGRLIDAGYAVLMYDLRNHGLSEKNRKRSTRLP